MGCLSPAWAWMSLLHVVQQALLMWLSVQQVMKDNNITRGPGGRSLSDKSPIIAHFGCVSFRGELPSPLLR